MHNLLQILDETAVLIEHSSEVIGGGVMVMVGLCGISIEGGYYVIIGFSLRFAVNLERRSR